MEIMQPFTTGEFWLGLLEVIWINILLSGDNAVVIALAARGLPPVQQQKAILIGSGFAVILLVSLTLLAAQLLAIPGLQIVGGCLLFWIGAQLLAEEEEGDDHLHAHATLFAAVRTILIADLVMSLDNVIGVAAAAHGNMLLMILGLAVSIPLVIFGSSLMIKIMDRFKFLIVLGAALIGYIGGETIANDELLEGVRTIYEWLPMACGSLGALIVLTWGRFMENRNRSLVQ